MKILLLSPYDALSHRYWREALVRLFPQHQWTQLSLPPRFFNWRVRGNALSWAFQQAPVLQQEYDLLLATSMTELSALRGLIPSLAAIPTVLYFHENQFAYPPNQDGQRVVEPQMVSIYSACCADHLLFNSDYNRQTFLQGVTQLFKKLPDAVPKDLVSRLQEKSSVIQVPLHDDCFRASRADGPFTIVWNHRWEYDKAPERFFSAIRKLHGQTRDFRLYMLGQTFREVPAVFRQAQQDLDDVIAAWGFVESRPPYLQLLQSAHVAVSSSLHDFQGLAVLEAVACGCEPVVPRRLAYPEFFSEEYCFEPAQDAEQEAANLYAHLLNRWQQHAEGKLLSPPSVSDFSGPQLKPRYAALFAHMTGG